MFCGLASALLIHFVTRLILRAKGSKHLDLSSSINKIPWTAEKSDKIMGDGEQVISWIRRVMYGKSQKEAFYACFFLFLLKTFFNKFVSNFVGIWLVLNCFYISACSGRCEPRYLWDRIQSAHDIMDGLYQFFEVLSERLPFFGKKELDEKKEEVEK